MPREMQKKIFQKIKIDVDILIPKQLGVWDKGFCMVLALKQKRISKKM